MTERELKESILNDPNLTAGEKNRKLEELREPYKKMSDEELLQIVRDFAAENGRLPERVDLLCDTILKQRFGPWGRVHEKAGIKEVATKYLDRQKRKKEKHERQKENRKLKREEEKVAKELACADDEITTT